MKIHLVGVGGVAMGNLAAMLKELGHDVTGSDQNLYPPMSDQLKEKGIKAKPYDATNIGKSDLYIIGNVISRGNPEVEAILANNEPYMSLPAALAEFFLKGKEVIVVAGTHGKTTTSFLMDHILTECGEIPGFFSGGVRADGMSGYRISKSKYFVIEGDEYDSAFFDKRSKFVHYRPRYVILTSIEFDHADIYSSFTEYIQAFERMLRLVPNNGLVISCADDAGVREVMENYTYSPILWYGSEFAPIVAPPRRGEEEEKPIELMTFRREGVNVEFDFPGEVENFPLPGNHNANNALAASLLARELGMNQEQVLGALKSFPGVKRRQQILWQIQEHPKTGKPVIFMDDFAHHPGAVRETIAAIRETYPGHAVHILFEPRSATSHTKIFYKQYLKEFVNADHVYIAEVHNPDKIPEENRLNVQDLVDRIREVKDREFDKKVARYRGVRPGMIKSVVEYGKDPETLLNKFTKKFKPYMKGDVVLVMSNGSFGGIQEKITSFLEKDAK